MCWITTKGIKYVRKLVIICVSLSHVFDLKKCKHNIRSNQLGWIGNLIHISYTTQPIDMKVGIRIKHIIISFYTKNDNYNSGIFKDIKSVRMDW